MIIQTGQRTDIPAFYSKWLINRIKEGFVVVRSPYNPSQLFRYSLSPDVVDIIGFCTKNPAPLLPYIDRLKSYKQYWHITITPYGKDIEQNVPDKHDIISSFRKLSEIVGKRAVAWRYDPILISDKYPLDFHIEAFSKMAENLKGYTEIAIISFIDLYAKTRRNFPEAQEVNQKERLLIGKTFLEIARKNNMTLKTCAEGNELETIGVDCSGCMTIEAIEKATGLRLSMPRGLYKREGCSCCLCSDIGAYNTCIHLCKYCYANYDSSLVLENYKHHNPDSQILIGNIDINTEIQAPKQYSWIDKQGVLEL